MTATTAVEAAPFTATTIITTTATTPLAPIITAHRPSLVFAAHAITGQTITITTATEESTIITTSTNPMPMIIVIAIVMIVAMITPEVAAVIVTAIVVATMTTTITWLTRPKCVSTHFDKALIRKRRRVPDPGHHLALPPAARVDAAASLLALALALVPLEQAQERTIRNGPICGRPPEVHPDRAAFVALAAAAVRFAVLRPPHVLHQSAVLL